MGPKEIHYLFVDGASLHGRIDNVSKRFLAGQKLEIDFAKLCHGFSKVFYYDAIPVQNAGEDLPSYKARTHEQRDRHERAARINGVHVYEGDARLRRKKYEQKKVDVMIAVDLMHHTFRHNMHMATLLTGDGDFKPLVDAVVREGMQLTLWYPPGETSDDLLDSADARRMLGFSSIRDVLTEESQTIFNFPLPESKPPGEVQGAKRVRTWGLDQNQELWEHGGSYTVVRNWDKLNAYHVCHGNVEVIKAVCAEWPHMFSLPADLFA